MINQHNGKLTKFEKFKILRRKNTALYGIISANPPIFYVKRFPYNDADFSFSFQILFDYLRNTNSYFFYNWGWWMETENEILETKRIEKELEKRYPKLKSFHLCNTPRQLELFQENGLNSIFCNHNCLLDENIFKPLPSVQKKIDAVYDARLIDWKRHNLAEKISSIALIYYSSIGDSAQYITEVKNQFKHAHFFNHDESGNYRTLHPAQINECLNVSRVGLCLSHIEGAMCASGQYLLSGLPVVSTESYGGRDVFFDDDYAFVVKANADAVREGVQYMIGKNLSAEMIREKTIKKMLLHRKRLISLVQQIYDETGCGKNFQNEWNEVFFNKLSLFRFHANTIEELKKQI